MKRTFLMGFLGGIVGFIMMAGLIGLANPASAWFSSQQEPPGDNSASPAGLEVTAQFTKGERLTADIPVGTAFTYQGYLKKDGQPYTGKCEVYFYLYDGGGDYVDEYYLPEVNFTNGLFSVDIDYGAGEFKGAYRAIIPSFICNGVQGTMDAQPIRAVPYAITALGLRPGALIEGTALNSYQSVLGVHSQSTAVDSKAIYGLSEQGYGIYAATNSTTYPALMAYSQSGPALGIYGKIEVYGPNGPVFKHTVTISNKCSSPYTYMTVIDNIKVNNNPNALLLVTYQNLGGNPPRSPVGVSYLTSDAYCGSGTTGHWIIYSLANPGEELLPGQTFNVLAIDLVEP